jgi:hypothetical protein
MKNIKFRKVQQSVPGASLEINVPVSFARRLGLEKSDLVSCRTVLLQNGKHSLIVEKIDVKPTTLVEIGED